MLRRSGVGLKRPRRRCGSEVAWVLLCLVLGAVEVGAQVADPVPGNIPLGQTVVSVELVVQLPDSGPVFRPRARPMVLSGDGSGRRFVADQNGIIYQIHADDSLSVFLDVEAASSLVTDFGVLGVASFAFHPDYFDSSAPGFGKFYTSSAQTAASGVADFPVPAGAPTSHHAVVHEWEVMAGNPEAIDPASRRDVLRIGEPYSGHGLGQIAFDPNAEAGNPDHGLLYVALGDGGSPSCCPPLNDFHLVAQDLSSPLGKLLRIDPLASGPDSYAIPGDNPFAADGDASTLGEIWAYGLRNPHRFSFDTGGSGPLLLSDIGASNVEEINLVHGGANYGWSEREGTFLVVHENNLDVFSLPPDDATLGFSYPVVQYDHDEGDRAISGGYVYRGVDAPGLSDEYVFGDLVSGRVFSVPAALLDGSGQMPFSELQLVDAAAGELRSLLEMIGGGVPAPRADLRFGMDDAGEIYLLTKQDGSVRRIASVFSSVPSLSPWGIGLLGLALSLAALRRSTLG